MRKINVFTIPVLLLIYCNGLAKTSDDDMGLTKAIPNPAHLFTKADAEKILGEPAQLEDSATIVSKDAVQYKSSYIANAKDPKTGKTGGVYFLFERYNSASTAHEIYASFKEGNQNNKGFKTLQEMGDEAYFHSDGENFHLIIVRKGTNMFRIKVNKITSTTSLNEFNLVAKNITAEL